MRLFLFGLIASLFLTATACNTDRDRERPRERRERRYDGPVIDMHAHLVMTGMPEEAEVFRKNAADPRLQRITAMVTAPLGKMDETRSLNDKVLALAKESSKIVPVPSVHPYDVGALDEIARVGDQGASLLLLDATTQGFDFADPRVGAVLQRCGERGMVVVVEASTVGDANMLGKVIALAMKNPQTQIIVAHMGFTHFQDVAVFSALQKNPSYADNVWFDVASTAQMYVGSPYEEQLAWVIRRFPKKVMFGSDFPIYSSSTGIDAVQGLGLSEGEQADVLYGNAARLLKLTGG